MADEHSSDLENTRTTSRRTLLKGAAVGAGAVWVAPAVATFTASPAAASPAGCADCSSPNIAPTSTAQLNAGVTNLTTPAFTTGTSTGGGTGRQNRDFDATCRTRLGQPTTVQPQATATLSATVDNGSSSSSVTLTLYSGLAQTGSATVITINSTTPSRTFNIPIGTQSYSIAISTGTRNGGGQQPGSITNLTFRLSC